MSSRVLLGLVTAIALSGCGGTEDPPPPPPTGTATTSAASPVPSVPPSVSDPLDLTPYARHPCTALTAQQLTELGLPSERIEELSVDGRGEIWRCQWAWRDSSHKPGLYTFTVHPTGDPLSKAYQDRNSRRGESDTAWRFEEHTVRGLPAMARFTGEGDHGCELTVGAGNGQGFTLWAGASSVPDAGMCQRLVTAAELVVDTARS